MCPTINRHAVTFERNPAGASTKAACLCVTCVVQLAQCSVSHVIVQGVGTGGTRVVSLVWCTWYSVSHVHVWYRELVQEAHALCHLCGTGGGRLVQGAEAVSVCHASG